VDGVGQQRDRPRDRHHGELRERSRAERDQADLDRTDALCTGLQRVIEGVSGVVRVRAEHMAQAVSQATSPVRAMIVTVRTVLPVTVTGILEAHFAACAERTGVASSV
jgi:hypothetical protein